MLNLNSNQQRAVEHRGSPLLVLAGAGSGKTRVITRKIEWLIQQRAVMPEDITAVTFTNKAAREMRQRVEQSFSDIQDLQGLTISTFHSLGMKILRQHSQAVGLKANFSIIDPRDVNSVLAEQLKADLVRNRDLLDQTRYCISAWKNAGIGPEQVQPNQSNPVEVNAGECYPLYQRYLRACNSVDLDDLIYLPVVAFNNEDEILQKWRRKVRYLLVDEYQDTNAVQYQLVRLLAEDGKRLTVVGDDDQSIYAWRGARPENLVQLKTDFPSLTVIKLEQNYRSCGIILKAANALIEHNPRAFDKTLWSSLGHGQPIRISAAENESVEAERTVSGIMRHQFKHQSRYQDFAILYRSNHQAKELEIKLREMRIPYRISGGSSFFDRSEIRDVIAYLRLLTNPADDTAFLRIINTPKRGVGTTSLEKMAAYASQQRKSLFDCLTDSALGTVIKPGLATTLRQLHSDLTQLSAQAVGSDPVSAVEDMLTRIRYQQWLRDTSDKDAGDRRWENVMLLVQWLEDARLNADSPKTLQELVTDLILNDTLEQQKQDEEINQVSLMTLHAAKGLEFPHVFIVGVEEEILPHRSSIEEGNDQEERRLFYVGITRAMETLSISYAKKRKRFGDVIECTPSRFLDELPQEDIEWDKGESSNPEQIEDTARTHLASIRAMRNRTTEKVD